MSDDEDAEERYLAGMRDLVERMADLFNGRSLPLMLNSMAELLGLLVYSTQIPERLYDQVAADADRAFRDALRRAAAAAKRREEPQ